MAEKLTHAQFAERVAYMASHCAQWAGSCLTLPEKVNEPMLAWSVRRFLDEMQPRLDYLREDLAALEPLYAHPAPATVEMLREAFDEIRCRMLTITLKPDEPVIHVFDRCVEAQLAALAPATEGRKA